MPGGTPEHPISHHRGVRRRAPAESDLPGLMAESLKAAGSCGQPGRGGADIGIRCPGDSATGVESPHSVAIGGAISEIGTTSLRALLGSEIIAPIDVAGLEAPGYRADSSEAAPLLVPPLDHVPADVAGEQGIPLEGDGS